MAEPWPDCAHLVLFGPELHADDGCMWRNLRNPWFWLTSLLVAVLLWLGLTGAALLFVGMRAPG